MFFKKVLVFVVFIVAAVQASKSQTADTSGDTLAGDAPVASFSGVWTALILIVLAIVGTVIMRRVRTFVEAIPSL